MRRRSNAPTLVIGALALLALTAAAPGCYRKVTSARGIGSDSIQTEQRTRNDGIVDQILYGKDEQKKR